MGEIFSIAGVLTPSSIFKILKVKDYVDAAVIVHSKLTAIYLFAAIIFAFLFPNLKVSGQFSATPIKGLNATGSRFNQGHSHLKSPQFFTRNSWIPPNSWTTSYSFQTIYHDSLNPLQLPDKKSRLWIVAGSHVAIWAGTFVALNHAWYRDYPKSSFHLFDDRKEWKQMDKAGHVWTSYQLSRHSAASWKWAGMTERQSAWFGGGSAFAFQSIIEILDGFSEEWGFSIGDMEANLIGSGGYVLQQLLFKEQMVQVKFGYNPYDYPDDLKPRRDQLFGKSLPEQLLKDYNSQRYWLSANLKSISGSSKLPAWLNLAFGYSADGLYGAESNVWTDEQGNYFDRSDIARVRRFYLSPDIDLTKIKTKNKFLRSVFFILNMVKVPAPAIEYNTNGKLKFHPLLF